MWDLPGPGIEPMSPILADGFFTTKSPGKPQDLGSFAAVFLWCCGMYSFFGCAMCLIGSKFPDKGQNPGPQQWKCQVLTTKLPGSSHDVMEHSILKNISYWILTSFIGFWFGLVIERLGFLWTLSFSHSDLTGSNLWEWIFFESVSYIVQYKPSAYIAAFDSLKWLFWKMGKAQT